MATPFDQNKHISLVDRIARNLLVGRLSFLIILELGIYEEVKDFYVSNVNPGTSHDTSEFAVTSISCWWNAVGINAFPATKRITSRVMAAGAMAPRAATENTNCNS